MIGKKPPPEAGIKVRWRGGGISLAHRRDFIQQLQSLTGDGPSLPMELNAKEFQGFHLALLNKVRLGNYQGFWNVEEVFHNRLRHDQQPSEGLYIGFMKGPDGFDTFRSGHI